MQREVIDTVLETIKWSELARILGRRAATGLYLTATLLALTLAAAPAGWQDGSQYLHILLLAGAIVSMLVSTVLWFTDRRPKYPAHGRLILFLRSCDCRLDLNGNHIVVSESLTSDIDFTQYRGIKVVVICLRHAPNDIGKHPLSWLMHVRSSLSKARCIIGISNELKSSLDRLVIASESEAARLIAAAMTM